MARDDTRLHRLEAMVAGLLAWQNLAERQLQRQQKRLDDIAGAIGSILHCCTELEARVAALEHSVHEVDVDTNTRLRALEAGGPEPAAPAQAACPQCGKPLDNCPSGHKVCMGCGWQADGCEHPEWAAQPAPLCPICHKPTTPHLVYECGEHTAEEMQDAEAQPAPQQPRSCGNCKHMEAPGSQPPCYPSCLGSSERPCWQPRGGGG